jgi:hypothetical protein
MGGKWRNHRLTIPMPRPERDMTVKQYEVAKQDRAAKLFLQRSFDDDAARALEQKGKDKLVQLDLKGQVLNIYVFPRKVLTSEPSILYDQVPSRLYHHGPKHPISKMPVEILSTIFHQLPLFDRANLARCSKRLAKIAVENKILELKFKDRDRLSDRKGFFADPSNFPLLWSSVSPEFWGTMYGTWRLEAQTEIERQGGTYTQGIHEAIDWWFISEMDANDERIWWHGY